LGKTWYACASSVIPRNIVIASPAIISIVEAAFLDSGGLKAGTPLDTASTPVMAVQPLAKAVSNRNSVNGSTFDDVWSTAGTGWTDPVNTCHTPNPISVRVVKMKK